MSNTFSSNAIPNRFDYAEAAPRIYRLWEDAGAFHAEPDKSRDPFSIVIPPPNVTGALHLGHALNNTLQDILIRWKRMQGFNVLWMPGTDHAGIATQAVVEKRLREEEGLTRHDLGREKLVQRIWTWKDQYEARILRQLKQMGCSCDWERTRFTLDTVCATAVRQTFFNLFREGLIYRGKRLVNWDPFLQTAVSDDEVFHETVKGHEKLAVAGVVGAAGGGGVIVTAGEGERAENTEPGRGMAGCPDAHALITEPVAGAGNGLTCRDQSPRVHAGSLHRTIQDVETRRGPWAMIGQHVGRGTCRAHLPGKTLHPSTPGASGRNPGVQGA